MDKSVISKRYFYLEQSMKKAWKELKRLGKACEVEDAGFHNRPLEKLGKEGE